MFQEHIQHIKETEKARIELHKILNSDKPINDQTLFETFNVCMEIISTIFKGEFI